MKDEPILKRKTSVWLIILGTILVVLGFMLGGCIRLTDEAGNLVKKEGGVFMRSPEAKFEAPPMNPALVKLKALVKGSIYGTGEAVTVYGTCMDGYDKPVLNASGYISSWYPNGTQQLVNQSMVEFQDGYFIYMGYMDAVQGTYLTEFKCVLGDDTALAWGEWQNPYWVSQIQNISIGNISIDLSQVIEMLQNITLKLDNLSVGVNLTPIMEQLYNMTLTQNEQYANVTAQMTNISVQIYDLSQTVTMQYYNLSGMLGNISDFLLQMALTINDTYMLVNQSYMELVNLSVKVDGLIYNITVSQAMMLAINDSNYVWHNITWGLLDQTNQSMVYYFNNLTQQITQVGQIANYSVDRNDSLLARLLLNLTRCMSCANMSGIPLNFTSVYDTPILRGMLWHITVYAQDSFGSTVQYPDSLCTISTSLIPGPTLMTPQGNHFIYSETITGGGQFTWTVSCAYA